MLAPSKNQLSLALMDSQWSVAHKLVLEKPKLASKCFVMQGFFEGLKDATVYPLHQAAAAPGVPVELVDALIDANPSAMYKKESSYERLPLHCACRTAANPAVVESLLYAADKFKSHFPDQSDMCLATDLLRRLPIHYALSNGANLNTIRLLLKSSPAAARAVDQRGWTPLHVAASVGCSPEVFALLLEENPAAVSKKTLQGSLPRTVLNKKHPNHKVLLGMLKEASQANKSRPLMKEAAAAIQRSVSVPTLDQGLEEPNPVINRSASADEVPTFMAPDDSELRPLPVFRSVLC